MKKFLKWAFIVIGSLCILFVATALILNQTGFADKQVAKAKRANGKLLAGSVLVQMSMMQIESDAYPDIASLKAAMAQNGSVKFGDYDFGVTTDDPRIAEVCPDCAINKDSFKLAIYGNIDEDEELDVITVDQDRKLMLIQDDSGENSEPVDISPKQNT